MSHLAYSSPFTSSTFPSSREHKNDRRPIIDQSHRHTLKRFWMAESGAVTLEAILWLPLYLAFFALVVDASAIMHSRTVSMRIIEDANRHAVTGYLTSQAEVQSQITSQMQAVSAESNIEVSWNADDISSVVSYPASDVQIVGLLDMFTDIQLVVRSFNRFEI